MLPEMTGLQLCRTLKDDQRRRLSPSSCFPRSTSKRIACSDLNSGLTTMCSSHSTRENLFCASRRFFDTRQILVPRPPSSPSSCHARSPKPSCGRTRRRDSSHSNGIQNTRGSHGEPRHHRSAQKLAGFRMASWREISIRTIDSNVIRLRKKLGASGCHIHTVRSFGYRMDNVG